MVHRANHHEGYTRLDQPHSHAVMSDKEADADPVATLAVVIELCEAARHGDLDRTREALRVGGFEYGSDVALNTPCPRMTPLALATRGGHTAVMKLLLDHGSDPDARTIQGSAPIHLAAYMGEFFYFLFCMSMWFFFVCLDWIRPWWFSLADPCELLAGKSRAVRVLAEYGANVNAQHGSSPRGSALHVAVRQGNRRTVLALLGADASILETDDNGASPVEVAESIGRHDMVAVFNRHGGGLASEYFSVMWGLLWSEWA